MLNENFKISTAWQAIASDDGMAVVKIDFEEKPFEPETLLAKRVLIRLLRTILPKMSPDEMYRHIGFMATPNESVVETEMFYRCYRTYQIILSNCR